MEIATLVPSKIDRGPLMELFVHGHLHISSYFHDGSIRPVLIGKKKFGKPMNIDFAFEA